MIRVTIEMWPGGSEQGKYTLGHIDIANRCARTVASGGSRGDYVAEFFGKDGRRLRRRAEVLDWPRLAKPVFALVWKVLTKGGYAVVP